MFIIRKVKELLHNPLTDKLILFGDKVSNYVRLKFSLMSIPGCCLPSTLMFVFLKVMLDKLVFGFSCYEIVVFLAASVCFQLDKAIRGLCKLPDGRDWLGEKLDLALMDRAMFNKL